MEINDIKELIQEVSKSKIDEFSYEEGNTKIKLSKKKKQIVGATEVVVEQAVSAAEPVEVEAPVIATGKEVKSPLVGTFYVAPAEDADPFVTVGDTVKKGDVLAIVEAMKLMNEITSEFDGVIKQVCVENETPVEYGQVLFVIE